MTRPAHLFLSSDGKLYDTRDPAWLTTTRPLREKIAWYHARITTPAELKATLRHGEHIWPGGYPLYFVMTDGEAMSFAAVRKNLREIIAAFDDVELQGGGWRVAGCEANYEDPALYCTHSNERIPSAYAEDLAAVETAKHAFDINGDSET